MNKNSAARLTVLGLLVVGIITFLVFLISSQSVQETSVSLLTSLESYPVWISSAVMILLFALALLFFCPVTPFNLACGFLYGVYWGGTVAIAGCILGSSLAFLLGRTIAREWVKSFVAKKPKFLAVDWALQKNGIYIVFLTRLSPLFPFPLLNYTFGITKIKAWQYLVGTVGGVIPGTIVYCYLGTLMRSLADIWTLDEDEGPSLYLLIGGGVVMVLTVVIISIVTQRAISKATSEYNSQHLDDLESVHVETSVLLVPVTTEELQMDTFANEADHN